MILSFVIFDITHADRLYPPGMVDKDLGVYSKGLVEPFLVDLGALCHITHGVHVMALQAPCLAGTYLPEVREGFVVPEQYPVAFLIKLGDAHPVFVGDGLFGNDVHGYFGQVKVGADADGGGDAGGGKHIPDDGPGHGMCARKVIVCGSCIKVEVVGAVNETLVYAVNMDILGRGVFKVHGVYRGGYPFIFGHAGDCDDIGYLYSVPPLVQTYGLFGLKQPGPSGNAHGLEGGGDRKADGLIRTALISHQEICLKGIKPSGHTLHRGIKARHIYGYKCAFTHITIIEQMFCMVNRKI